MRAKLSGVCRRNSTTGCLITANSDGVDATGLDCIANGGGPGTGFGLDIHGKDVTVRGGRFNGKGTDDRRYNTDPASLTAFHNVNIRVNATASGVLIDGPDAPEGTNSSGRSIQVAGGATDVEARHRGTLTPNSNLLYGSPGSTYLKTDTGVLWTKMSGAVDALGQWGKAPLELATVTATLDFPSINAAASNTQSVTVTGAAVGDTVVVGVPNGLHSGLVVRGQVTSTNTVGVVAYNATAGPVDPASADFDVTVLK